MNEKKKLLPGSTYHYVPMSYWSSIICLLLFHLAQQHFIQWMTCDMNALVPHSTDTQSLARDTPYCVYLLLRKVYTGYCDTSEIEHGQCASTVDNPLAKARGLSVRTGAQTLLYLS